MQPARPRLHRGLLLLGVVLVVLVVLVVWAAVAVVVAFRSRDQVVDGHPRACGGERVVGADGRAWTCSLEDDFSGTRLNPRVWDVLTTAATGFHTGAECFVDDGRHVRVGGGDLVLTLTTQRQPMPCAGRSTTVLSGMVTSKAHFAQTYGRFEIRARVPTTTGVQPALWLYPQTLRYGVWPRSGEIDVAETFGIPDLVAPHLHYLGASGARAAPGSSCRVPGAASDFHTYAVDWTPANIRFDYDGRPCWQAPRIDPAPPLRAPQPFDQPFFLLLELAAGSTPGNLPSPSMPASTSLVVDRVRVWRR